ncbi:hypothetical protein DSCA_53060 [Desulfosarcina alkanivorans]|uniref:Uncharacterized protein n=1 Tax=Desulfosarcina alkanivorans TaxID=571177 RepID=A0A5K7YQ41_9BACT|nr:hypothetical protein [Desulfosarcina alkanivorans]BBO71376.1 hypothetical protein DSCA_53060 [Desulfosarcina alkanivorans]
MTAMSLTKEELKTLASSHSGFLGLDLSRISSVFIAQTFQMQANRVINVIQMLDEVRYLEGIKESSSTKKTELFRHPPLKGLRKKHFLDSQFIPQNMDSHYGFSYGGNKNLDKTINELIQQNKSGWIDDEFIGELSHRITFGAIEERARIKKLTGEWIVFQIYQNKNYYLTLGSHDEGDERIWERVKDVYDLDFPFLANSA